MTDSGPPFSRIFQSEDARSHSTSVHEVANAQERQQTAKLLDVLAVDLLEFSADLSPAGDGAFDVTGSVSARLVQTCVITLEPITVEIENAINARFVPDQALQHDDTEELNPDVRDLEPLGDGSMDLGQLAYEHLVIALDPYPKRAGSAFDESHYDGAKEQGEDHPFSALRQLKER